MLRSHDDRSVKSVKMTPLRKGRSATALFSPGHNDDETEKQVARQTRQLEQKNRHLNLMSPVLSSPKASKAKIPATAADLNTSRSNLASVASISLNASASNLPAALSVTKLTREQMTKTFDEWMKIAADNKINAKNSWNFALIDYFSELSLLRDGEGINFQKASCTLDGCVKIYSSRIDSAVDETGQLLVGLATEGLEGDEAAAGQKSSSALSRKRLGGGHGSAESTLAKTIESLNVRSYDLEFSVDPLFRKTCADFDESGSNGKLLLNHLTMSSSGSILLDASQARFDAINEPVIPSLTESESVQVDIPWLGDGLEAKEIMPSLFSVTQTPSFDLSAMLENLSRLSLTQSNFAPSDSDPFQSSPFKLNESSQKDGSVFSIPGPFEDGDSFGDADGSGSGGEDEPESTGQNIRLANLNSSLLPSSSSVGSGGMVSTEMETETEMLSLSQVHSSLLNYVQATQHWAGPEHWKISRAHPTLLKSTLPTSSSVSLSKKVTKTRSAAVFEPFDFSIAPQVDIKALFAPPSSLASVTLPFDSIILNSPKARNRNLLPVDLGLNSKTLLGLFSKPGQLLEGKLEKMMTTEYVLQQSVDDALQTRSEAFSDGTSFEDDFEPSATLPFGESVEGDALNESTRPFSTSQWTDFQQGSGVPLSSQPLHVARFAKRVDVHLLKENLLSILSPMMSSSNTKDKLFSSALKELKSCYAETEWHQVSPAYCFVSLLHLANEQNLSLKSFNSGSDLIVQSD